MDQAAVVLSPLDRYLVRPSGRFVLRSESDGVADFVAGVVASD
jgi:hypothetical protein